MPEVHGLQPEKGGLMASKRGQKRAKAKRKAPPKPPGKPRTQPTVPIEDWVVEMPFDHAEFMNRRAVPTYEEDEKTE